MNGMLDFGIQVTLAMQYLGSWLAFPMKLLSSLGTEQFFLLIAPFVIWCIDPILGLRLGITMVLSGGLNAFFKSLLHGPRPYWYDSRVTAYVTETSFGIPSGHSQNAMVFWGVSAAYLKRNWAWITTLALTLLIGLSRIYLGVHFFTDVLSGWLIGALLLWAIIKLEKPISGWIKKQPISGQIMIVAAASLLLILLNVAARFTLNTWTLPQAWIENAALAAPEAEPIDPFSLTAAFSTAGILLGMGTGAILLFQRGGYNAKGTWGQYAVRYGVGVIGVIILWMGLGQVFPSDDTWLSYALRYLRYGLAGIWLTGFAPLIFIRLKLAKKNAP